MLIVCASTLSCLFCLVPGIQPMVRRPTRRLNASWLLSLRLDVIQNRRRQICKWDLLKMIGVRKERKGHTTQKKRKIRVGPVIEGDQSIWAFVRGLYVNNPMNSCRNVHTFGFSYCNIFMNLFLLYKFLFLNKTKTTISCYMHTSCMWSYI